MPITDPTSRQFENLADLQLTLINEGCVACDLGFQEGLNGCCVARGNPLKRRMIIGEAPGRFEDAQSSPFVGPAGILWDKIMLSVGWTDEDWYITNCVLCRPIAPKGSGKENFTPRVEQRKKCRPYLDAQIRFIRPRVIVTLGKPATETILGHKGIRMGNVHGRKFLEGEKIIFPLYHPAFLLHSQKNPQQYQEVRENMWQDIQKLREIVDEENL